MLYLLVFLILIIGIEENDIQKVVLNDNQTRLSYEINIYNFQLVLENLEVIDYQYPLYRSTILSNFVIFKENGDIDYLYVVNIIEDNYIEMVYYDEVSFHITDSVTVLPSNYVNIYRINVDLFLDYITQVAY